MFHVFFTIHMEQIKNNFPWYRLPQRTAQRPFLPPASSSFSSASNFSTYNLREAGVKRIPGEHQAPHPEQNAYLETLFDGPPGL